MNGDLYSILLHVHSIGRWILLLLLVIAIFNSLIAGKRPFIKSDARTGLLLTIVADTMLLVGLILWYWGPKGYNLIAAAGGMSNAMKDPITRFYGVEHITAMIIAIVLIHLGKAQSKKAISDKVKHSRTVIFYTIALLVILLSVPWPFRDIAGGWF
jgi:hypothetical protein